MGMDTGPNATERRRWNDAYWAGVWPRREQLTGAVTEMLLDRADLSSGQRLLDIGSGAGIASLAATERVGSAGFVIGADVSVPLVEYAKSRAERTGVDNVKFVVADLQVELLEDAPFDAAISQFGVMFFDEPVDAFVNIRVQLATSGRLTFACWQPLAQNDWHLNHAIGRFLPPPRSTGPQPGAFSLGNPGYATEILERAGWRDIESEALELAVNIDRDAIVDDDQLAFNGVPVAQLEIAKHAVDDHLRRFERADGRYDVTLAVQLFTCVA
jgi:SAM-dependent methyltransferase